MVQPNESLPIQSPAGMTPLTYAAQIGNIEELTKLHVEGLDVDLKDDYGWTALMYAADQGHVECVQFLLDKGAKPDITDDYDLSAHFLAECSKNTNVVNILGQHPCSKTNS